MQLDQVLILRRGDIVYYEEDGSPLVVQGFMPATLRDGVFHDTEQGESFTHFLLTCASTTQIVLVSNEQVRLSPEGSLRYAAKRVVDLCEQLSKDKTNHWCDEMRWDALQSSGVLTALAKVLE